jgi:hypothetical protein
MLFQIHTNEHLRASCLTFLVYVYTARGLTRHGDNYHGNQEESSEEEGEQEEGRQEEVSYFF